MTATFDLALEGIRPEPLGSYLKALAVLRLVSAQKDPRATGYWRDDVFHLVSALDQDGLLRFFAEEYAPTPIVRPWAGRQAFLGNPSGRSARESLEKIEKSATERLQPFRAAIGIVRDIFRERGIDREIEDKDAANEIVTLVRARLPESALRWLDSAYIVGARDESGSFSRALPPIFGSGGNEGSESYASSYMAAVCDLGMPSGTARPPSGALFGGVEQGLQQRPAGQFLPGRAGGPNQGPRFEKGNSTPTDAWDVVLLIEGAMTWIGGPSVRQAERAIGRESSPFTVRLRGAAGSIAATDEQHRRGFEIWAPIWSRHSRFSELEALIAEGRMHIGKRPARTTLEMARAATGLGVDRGIDEFIRYPIVVRYGDKAFTTCAGRFSVRERPESELVGSLESALRPLDGAIRRDKNTPARVLAARRAVSEATFEVLRAGDPLRVTDLLRAIGRLDEVVSRWSGGRSIDPLTGLSPEWLTRAEPSPELRIAAAIASIRGCPGVGPLRSNLVGVDAARPNKWATGTGQSAWRGATLEHRLASVLSRRLMDGAKEKRAGNALEGRACASAGDVAAFLEARTSDTVLEELIHALTWIDWAPSRPRDASQLAEVVEKLRASGSDDDLGPPRLHALLKLCFWPRAIGEAHVVPEPSLVPLLVNGRVSDACRLAERRLRSHGLDVIDVASSLGGVRAPLDPVRLAGSLLIPASDLDALINAVSLRPKNLRPKNLRLKNKEESAR